jgi:exopolysaccharide biosynthesis polyprenyl glycosylphosphotransferase
MDQHLAHERVRGHAHAPPASSTRFPTLRTVPVEAEAESPLRVAEQLAEASNLRERRLRRALALADATALCVALLVSVAVASTNLFTPAVLLLIPAVVAVAKIIGLYESDDQRIRKTTIDELPRLAQLGTLIVLGVWIGEDVFIRSETADQWQTLCIGSSFVAVAMLARRATRRLTNKRLPPERCLFVGDERSYVGLHAIFARHDLPAQLLPRVAVDETMIKPTAGNPSAAHPLLKIIADAGAHRLIIGPHAFTNSMTFGLVEAARAAGTRVSLLPDMLEVVGSSVDFDDLYGLTLLGVRHTQLSRSSRRLKRAFDFVGATFLVIPALPVMVALAIAIRRDSAGPALFRQQRVGRAGTAFTILKFRTMIDGAEALKDGLRPRNEAEGLFKISDDPRITPLGRWLRRTSLDELPQIFNVLRGQMSLVGPRPLIADEDEEIVGVDRGRLRLTPGMTGQWQISGSARVPLEDMVKLDHLYVSNWTLWGDVKILLRTVPYVLSRQGQ